MPAFLGVIVSLSLLENALNSRVVDDDLVRRTLGGDREADSSLSRYLYDEGFINRLSGFACRDLVKCCAEGSSIALLREMLGDVVKVKLYATDTASSQLCAVALVKCLASRSRELGVEVDGYTRFNSSVLGTSVLAWVIWSGPLVRTWLIIFPGGVLMPT